MNTKGIILIMCTVFLGIGVYINYTQGRSYDKAATMHTQSFKTQSVEDIFDGYDYKEELSYSLTSDSFQAAGMEGSLGVSFVSSSQYDVESNSMETSLDITGSVETDLFPIDLSTRFELLSVDDILYFSLDHFDLPELVQLSDEQELLISTLLGNWRMSDQLQDIVSELENEDMEEQQQVLTTLDELGDYFSTLDIKTMVKRDPNREVTSDTIPVLIKDELIQELWDSYKDITGTIGILEEDLLEDQFRDFINQQELSLKRVHPLVVELHGSYSPQEGNIDVEYIIHGTHMMMKVFNYDQGVGIEMTGKYSSSEEIWSINSALLDLTTEPENKIVTIEGTIASESDDSSVSRELSFELDILESAGLAESMGVELPLSLSFQGSYLKERIEKDAVQRPENVMKLEESFPGLTFSLTDLNDTGSESSDTIPFVVRDLFSGTPTRRSDFYSAVEVLSSDNWNGVTPEGMLLFAGKAFEDGSLDLAVEIAEMAKMRMMYINAIDTELLHYDLEQIEFSGELLEAVSGPLKSYAYCDIDKYVELLESVYGSQEELGNWLYLTYDGEFMMKIDETFDPVLGDSILLTDSNAFARSSLKKYLDYHINNKESIREENDQTLCEYFGNSELVVAHPLLSGRGFLSEQQPLEPAFDTRSERGEFPSFGYKSCDLYAEFASCLVNINPPELRGYAFDQYMETLEQRSLLPNGQMGDICESALEAMSSARESYIEMGCDLPEGYRNNEIGV